jgi:glycerol-3-phosphate O-acyltransferase
MASEDLPTDGEQIKRRALGLGQQYVAQRRLPSAESVSVLLFGTGLQLAANLGLLEPAPDLAARRAAFLAELRDLVRRLGQIEDLAIRRYIRDAVSTAPGD